MTPDDPRHGTANGYMNLGCRCDECRAAGVALMMKSRSARYEALRRGDAPPDLPHGRPSTYNNRGCRCRPCTDAWARDATERNHRKAEREGRALRPFMVAEHGTETRYKRHLSYGEEACEACKAGHNAYVKARRKQGRGTAA